jgi:hypothetical protein
MKFGAVLRDSAADLPDTADLFLKYKQLKKSLKRMQSTQQPTQNPSTKSEDNGDQDDGTGAGPSTKRAKYDKQVEGTHIEKDSHNAGGIFLLDPELEAEFLRVVTADVMELNDRYIEKEEDNIIKFGQLEDAAKAAATTTPESRTALYRAFVDLHGELLMLFHWSVLAYTGLVKILKKHRKQTGAPLHAPHLENLLSQPFCSVEVTCDMVRKAEEWVSKLAKDLHVPPPPAVPLPDGLLKRTEAHGSGDTIASPPHGGNLKSASGIPLNINGVSQTLRTSPEEGEKAKILQELAQVVAEAAETETAAHQMQDTGAEGTTTATNTGSEVGKKEEFINKSRAPVVEENLAVRKIRAALNVWHQLQSNVSTPSTMIAPGAAGSGAGGPVAVAQPPASLTTNSIA